MQMQMHFHDVLLQQYTARGLQAEDLMTMIIRQWTDKHQLHVGQQVHLFDRDTRPLTWTSCRPMLCRSSHRFAAILFSLKVNYIKR